jgi:hypothetical protein
MTEQEKQLQIEEKKVEAMNEIASGLNAIADALLQCATVQRKDIAWAIENVAASIANKDFFEPREEE